MEFSSEIFGDAWLGSIRSVLNSGEWVQSDRGQKTIELRNVALISTKPFAEPRIPDAYQFNSDYIEIYCHSFLKNESIHSINQRLNKYGSVGVNQIRDITKKIKDNPNTRRAVISLWDPIEDINSEHPPCPIAVQFIVRIDKLEMLAVLRSSDAWMAAIPDYIALTTIQRNVASQLGVNVGNYTQYSMSYHIYEFDVMIAKDVAL
jgi:thymidylate synthase (methanogen type)